MDLGMVRVDSDVTKDDLGLRVALPLAEMDLSTCE